MGSRRRRSARWISPRDPRRSRSHRDERTRGAQPHGVHRLRGGRAVLAAAAQRAPRRAGDVRPAVPGRATTPSRGLLLPRRAPARSADAGVRLRPVRLRRPARPGRVAARARAQWELVPVVIQDPVWERTFPDVSGDHDPVREPGSGRVVPVYLKERRPPACATSTRSAGRASCATSARSGSSRSRRGRTTRRPARVVPALGRPAPDVARSGGMKIALAAIAGRSYSRVPPLAASGPPQAKPPAFQIHPGMPFHATGSVVGEGAPLKAYASIVADRPSLRRHAHRRRSPSSPTRAGSIRSGCASAPGSRRTRNGSADPPPPARRTVRAADVDVASPLPHREMRPGLPAERDAARLPLPLGAHRLPEAERHARLRHRRGVARGRGALAGQPRRRVGAHQRAEVQLAVQPRRSQRRRSASPPSPLLARARPRRRGRPRCAPRVGALVPRPAAARRAAETLEGSTLERALAVLAWAHEHGDETLQRKAFERVASELGVVPQVDELSQAAHELAWSPRIPEHDEVEAFTDKRARRDAGREAPTVHRRDPVEIGDPRECALRCAHVRGARVLAGALAATLAGIVLARALGRSGTRGCAARRVRRRAASSSTCRRASPGRCTNASPRRCAES